MSNFEREKIGNTTPVGKEAVGAAGFGFRNRGGGRVGSARPQDFDTSERSRGLRQQVQRRRECPFSSAENQKIDYKDTGLLSKFLSERGKIVPSRVTFVCFKKQRELAKAIKRARFLALIPYVND